MMATIKITISRPHSGEIILDQTLEMSPELAHQFLAEMAAMVRDLPGQKRLIKRVRSGEQIVTEIDLTFPPSSLLSPTFQSRFGPSRSNETNLRAKEVAESWPNENDARKNR